MDIVVVNLSTFTSTEYLNAKKIEWDDEEQKYVITRSNNTTVSYARSAVIIGFKP